MTVTSDLRIDYGLTKIVSGLQAKVIQDNEHEIISLTKENTELKSELRQIREQQMLVHSEALFISFALYLCSRIGTQRLSFTEDNPGTYLSKISYCQIGDWGMRNHGLEFEIHPKIIHYAYVNESRKLLKDSLGEFWRDNRLITVGQAYTGECRDSRLKDDCESFFFSLLPT